MISPYTPQQAHTQTKAGGGGGGGGRGGDGSGGGRGGGDGGITTTAIGTANTATTVRLLFWGYMVPGGQVTHLHPRSPSSSHHVTVVEATEK